MIEVAKEFIHQYTLVLPLCKHVQLLIFHKKWPLSLNRTKLPSITWDILYISLYGTRILKYLAEIDKNPLNPETVLWEKSWLAR